MNFHGALAARKGWKADPNELKLERAGTTDSSSRVISISDPDRPDFQHF